MKKKFTLLLAAAMLLMLMSLPGKAVGQTRLSGSVTFSDLYNQDTDVNGTEITVVSGIITATFNKANGNNNPKYYASGSAVRLYAKGTLVISATDATIEGVTITFGTSDGSNAITANTGTYSDGSWTGSASSVTFTEGGTSGNRRIAGLTITYSTSGGGGSSVTAPTLTDGCAFTGTQTVTITPASETTVYYTTDGSTPDNTKTLYSSQFNVNATTTVKAIAYNGNNTSSVVEATYIKYGNISDITAAGDYAVTGTVVAKNNYSLVIGDGTGYVCYYNGYQSPSNNIGDNINIVGKIVENGSSAPKLWRFETGTSTITTASSSSYNPATATPTALDELTSTQTTGTHLSEYYSFTGTLIKTSASQYIVEIGKYSQIQLYGPTSTTNPSTTTLNDLENKKVNVTGYFTGKPSLWYSVMAETIAENTDPDTYEWVPVALSDLTSSDVFVIVGNNGDNYAMTNDKGTSKPVATGVTVSENKITSYVPMNLRWNISGNASDGYKFYPAGSTTTWLYCNGSPAICVGNTDSNNLFELKNNYLYNKGRSGYLGIYNSQDWRHYTSINSNITGQTFTFYKYQLITSDPTVSASPSTIDDFSYTYGDGPSIKSFTVGGTNLSENNITVALTTHTAFKLAYTEDAETWQNSLTFSPTNGTVANPTVYVRMNTGLAEGDYSDNISVTTTATGANTASVSLSGTVNPAPVTYNYILANTIEVGKHYLITSGKTGSVYVMGHQKPNNRNGVSVTVGDNGKISVTSDVINTENNVYEFVISGYGTNHWTIYDETDSGYLYAASSGSNYLRTQGTNDANGIWSVTIDSDTKVASIVAQGTNSRKVMQFNSNLFACYSDASYDDVYLFVKEENNCDIYSATNIDTDITIAGDMNIHAGVVTVKDLSILTVNGTLTNTTAANLVIKDGSLLYTETAGVAATVEKEITGWTTVDPADNWYFIASPLTGTTDFSGDGNKVTGLITDDYVGNAANTSNTTFDLYSLDVNEEGEEWQNYRQHNFSLTNGMGYLYASKEGTTLNFSGTIQPSNGLVSKTGLRSGFNLVGNPFTCEAYANQSYYILSQAVDGINTGTTAISRDNPIPPCTGIIISSNSVSFKNTEFTDNAINNGNVQIALAQNVTTRGESSSQTLDNAIVSFNEGSQLGKFYFGSQDANLYIPMDNEEYSIVSSSAQGELPVNFKAHKDGQYTITVNPQEVEMGYLHLIDNVAGKDIDLLATPSYTFNAKADDYESRFRLVFVANANDGESQNDFAFISNGSLIVTGEGTLQIFDILGHQLFTKQAPLTSHLSTFTFKAGVYVLRLIQGTDVKTQKIIVK